MGQAFECDRGPPVSHRPAKASSTGTARQVLKPKEGQYRQLRKLLGYPPIDGQTQFVWTSGAPCFHFSQTWLNGSRFVMQQLIAMLFAARTNCKNAVEANKVCRVNGLLNYRSLREILSWLGRRANVPASRRASAVDHRSGCGDRNPDFAKLDQQILFF